MNEVSIDISGTVVTDPVLRTTKSGTPFLSFRAAVNERRWNAQENTWADGEAQYFSVTAFRTLAGNAYHSVKKGQPIMVRGRLRVTSYTNSQGEQRTSVQIEANDLGTSLKFGQTSFTKCTTPDLSSLDKLADDTITEVTRQLEETEASAVQAGADEKSAETAGQLLPA